MIDIQSIRGLVPPNKKIRFVGLGCGMFIPQLLMGAGSSRWLHSVTIPYAKEATEELCTKNDSKFVSKERLEDLMDSLPVVGDDVITITVTAKLFFEGQRESRDTKFLMLIEHNGVRTFKQIEFGHKIYRRYQNRDQQEISICRAIRYYFMNLRSVVYAGSFNPVHDGHTEICEYVYGSGITTHPLTIQMSSTHPEKGNIPKDDLDGRVVDIHSNLTNTDLGHGFYEIEIVDAPYYESKYASWKADALPTEFLTLVVGHDVWDRYKKGFIKKLGDKDDVEFLVVDRGNKTPFNDSDLLDIMNPLSYTHDMKNSHLSSTQIRNQTKSE
jgi:nicotinic acid mononucleotide adenylyltransferase